jgi:hypothetical protein
MSVIFVQPDIEKLDTLLASIQEDVLVKTTLNVDYSELQSYARVGFLYHQDVAFPFVLEGGSSSDDNDGPGVGYFNQAWLDHFAQSTQIVDLLTCEYQEDLADMLKDVSVVATINYSTDTTGNTPIGDWILEKSINGNENVDVKAEYFTEEIQNWDVYLYMSGSDNPYYLIDVNNNILTYGVTNNYSNSLFAISDICYNMTLTYTDNSFCNFALIDKMFVSQTSVCGIDIKGDVYSFGERNYTTYVNDYNGNDSEFKPVKMSGNALADPNYYLKGIKKVLYSYPLGYLHLRDDGNIFKYILNGAGRKTAGTLQKLDISNIIQQERIVDFDAINRYIILLTDANKIYNLDCVGTQITNITITTTVSPIMPTTISRVFIYKDKQGYSLDINGTMYDKSYNVINFDFKVQDFIQSVYNTRTNDYNYILLDTSGNIYGGKNVSLDDYEIITVPENEKIAKLNIKDTDPPKSTQHFTSTILSTTGRVFSIGKAYFNGFDEDKTTFTELIIPGGTKIKNISNSETPLWNGLAVADICFLGDTIINTDQGKMKIKDVKAGKHTINHKKIKHVTQTRLSRQNTLMLFKKNALAPGVPDRNTYVTKDHKIMYDNKMVSAQYFELWNPNVKQVKYKMHTLYNIALEGKGTMIANNMQTETLDPSNKLYKIYDKVAHLSESEKVKFFENYNHKVRTYNQLA